ERIGCGWWWKAKKTRIILKSKQRIEELGWYLNCFVGQDSFLAWNVRETSTRVVGQSCSSFSLMAPFFVLLEVLQSLFGYEPYPGFHMRVNAKIKTEIKEWQDKKQKKVS
ncbi:hypothetical protein Goari_027200, partial [Gossypium aridum]|nr:hypothetical protein [Gossypium aridum]